MKFFFLTYIESSIPAQYSKEYSRHIVLLNKQKKIDFLKFWNPRNPLSFTKFFFHVLILLCTRSIWQQHQGFLASTFPRVPRFNSPFSLCSFSSFFRRLSCPRLGALSYTYKVHEARENGERIKFIKTSETRQRSSYHIPLSSSVISAEKLFHSF